MKKISTYLKFILLIVSFSCVKKEFEKIEMNKFDEEIVFPLANSELGIDKLLIKDPLDKNINTYVKDNLYHIVYKQTRKEYARDYYQLPDAGANFSKTLAEIGTEDPAMSTINILPFFTPISDISINSAPKEEKFILDMAANKIQNAELKRIKLFAGEVFINAVRDFNDLGNDIQIQYEMPGVKDANNNTLKGVLPIENGQTQNQKTVDLAGYTLNFNQNGVPNELTVVFKVTINAKKGNKLVKTDKVEATFSMRKLDYQTVEGQIGNFTIDSRTDTTKINAFDNVTNVELRIKDPKTIVNCKNTAGVKTDVVLEDIHYNRSDKTKKLDLINNTFDIPYLTSISNTAPAEKTYTISNKETIPEGEMTEALSFGPDKFITTTKIQFRGDEDPNFFLQRDSYTEVEIVADLPMEVNLIRYDLADTIKNDLQDLKDLVSNGTSTDSAAMRITSINTFPTDLLLDIVFTKGPDYEIVHKVTGKELLKSPKINNIGDTEGYTVQEIVVGFSEDEFRKVVLEADNIMLIARLQTPKINQNLGYVNIRPNNRLRLGIDFYIKSNIKL